MVVGTVIDPEMTDELRVTVVITGLGTYASGGARGSAHLKTARNTKDGTVDYHQLDRPTFMRNQDDLNRDKETVSQPMREVSEYLDIPAFLRRQDEG